MRTEGNGVGEAWAELLRQGLDTVADPGDEQPPSLAELQLMVAAVQREQRRQTMRALALFWACAVGVLGAGLYVAAGRPQWFLLVQGGAVVAALVAAMAERQGRRQVSQG